MKKCREKTEKPFGLIGSAKFDKINKCCPKICHFASYYFFKLPTEVKPTIFGWISFYRLWPIKCVTKHLFPNSKIITKSLQESCNHAVANRRGKNEKKS